MDCLAILFVANSPGSFLLLDVRNPVTLCFRFPVASSRVPHIEIIYLIDIVTPIHCMTCQMFFGIEELLARKRAVVLSNLI